ncbi:pseudouridine synthase [Actinomyces sp. HMT897]|uniref:pseudouridine synthase n=1 Tax=Actinomyces sp. HMT897 TaxID=2789424 RepID=UPI001FEE401C|nr:pseudouridine synthase [Actinomyces sp. HMT897]
MTKPTTRSQDARATQTARTATGTGAGTEDGTAAEPSARTGARTATGTGTGLGAGPGAGTGAARPALTGAVARLRRLLLGASCVLVAAQVAWTLLGEPRRPLPTLLVSAAATTALLSSIWLVLGRMVRSGTGLVPAWVAAGYVLRLGILAAAVVVGKVAGLGTRMIGTSLIVAVLTGLLAETVVLARTRILVVEPDAGPRP